MFFSGFAILMLYILLPNRYILSEGTYMAWKGQFLGGGTKLDFKSHMLTPLGIKLRRIGYTVTSIGMVSMLLIENISKI